MSNSKSMPLPRKPEARNGWVRKCDLDAYLDRNFPIPTQVVSNYFDRTKKLYKQSGNPRPNNTQYGWVPA